ncbi:hypothetical protein D0869_05530 [Hortaea werneckii]|uniref:ER membrane protein complex subunit 2 n=1 Tax=Hortaea werneckii TaxID=91943 RepID=A0A3M7B126_HORWE|nr:tetratricopeptide repeat domain-containing protein [Hortaea werneckii]KAI7002162.1 tetratricopeptide repeat domain-containing protein [Hortaea werneckii]KAI7189881.1 tetratricopeptide repeat domain-containing protein [Hortaea werneckii]KAI7571304.1 tetratricopeptide repeat domain-containing protein [Hortaea werneckii]KAI7666192.1 tetratricopeptide repeat domain-containing protein [Hortaea werneckii]
MATTSLLQPPTPSNPHHTLTLSQRAAGFFESQQSSFTLPYPLSLLSNTESQEKWATYESLFLACLRTSDNDAAYLCLEELTDRFGRQNERVMALQGLYKEAMAGSQGELEEVLRGYDEILKEDPTVFSIRKRRAALLRSMGKVSESVQELVRLLDVSPTDAETWAELADMYVQQGLYEQAVYCLEEVLVVMPNAWNMHARLGEVFYLASQRQEGGDQLKGLSESMRRFCRSIELCDDYLRGYYGLKLTTGSLLLTLEGAAKPQKSSSDPVTGDLAPPSIESVRKLNQAATAKLGEIIRRVGSGEKGWDGYNEAEIKAARELLEKGAQKIER